MNEPGDIVHALEDWLAQRGVDQRPGKDRGSPDVELIRRAIAEINALREKLGERLATGSIAQRGSERQQRRIATLSPPGLPCLLWGMSTPARTGVLSAAVGLSRAAALAPDWRKAFAGALAREVEERRFFLWLPVSAMGGVALNLAADSEPVLWLPAVLIVLFAALAWASRARPVAHGLALALAALFSGFLAMSLRTERVAAPVLDRIRIVALQGMIEEVDLRPVGARMIIAVASADGMPREKVPRRIRVTTRKTPDIAAGDFVALKARLLPPSHAALPGGYDFARDAFFAGVGAVGSTLGADSAPAAAR